MNTVMPTNELQRRAIQWISEMRREKETRSLHSLIDEAGMRFNLGPQDAAFLLNFFSSGSGKKQQ